MNTSANFPNVGSSIAGPDGRLSTEWFGFLLSLFNRTGGAGTPPDISEIQDQLEAQANEIADLFANVSASASTALVGALMAKIAYLERSMVATVTIPSPLQSRETQPVCAPRPVPDQAPALYAPQAYLFPRTPGVSGQVYQSNGPSKVAAWLTLGTMATQGANAVAITGGSVAGLSSLALGSASNNGALAELLTDSGSSPLGTALQFNGYGAASTVKWQQAGGTFAAPTATSAVVINMIGATTNDGTNYSNTIAIQGYAAATPAAGSHPTYISFFTTPTGSTSRSERARIDQAGALLAGTTANDGSGNLLQINSGISINPSVTTATPAAGGGGALPATPTGYATVVIGGTARKIPYY